MDRPSTLGKSAVPLDIRLRANSLVPNSFELTLCFITLKLFLCKSFGKASPILVSLARLENFPSPLNQFALTAAD
jgi:hypothetical protein